jgi:hypothetical protein
VSAPLQNRPSLHAAPFGSDAVHASAASLHVSLQSPSPSAPGHGLPAWVLQRPPLHWSAPLQNTPSLQGEPFGSGDEHASALSLQTSAQLPSPSAPGQGLPACTLQLPFAQKSAPLQNTPSLHGAPSGSLPVQPPAESLHDSAQFESPSGPGHGLP